MKEIVDRDLLEHFFGEQQAHFRQRPPVMQLIEFEKGEILNDPLQFLSQFYIIVKGSVSIYHLTEDGSIRYISKAASGTLLGDMEFSGAGNQSLYIEAAETVLCLAMPFRENQSVLENDPVFLRFVLSQLAGKLSLSAVMTASAQTLEEKVLFFLRKVQADHEISSVNHALQSLHCSRRQLQRVLKKLCDEGLLAKTGRGHYRLKK
ncbi:cyclic nucleotide-binding domain-containing protein [Agathobaculum sp. Marseille-P7918]|uniref:cyclic nucleotide-binding domain-containing protein n=1 Tax=Agathobaculum sp. Marseille-P7918 TaxID=2479843 RepID=UPI000F63DD0C|nr:cyclic nucleotide-binding domain-containing protein [Agathobaculum sp. Marseille-P7918]